MTKLDEKGVAVFAKTVTDKLNQLAKSEAWPLNVLATTVKIDVDSYDAVKRRTAGEWDPIAGGDSDVCVETRALEVDHEPLLDVRHIRTLTETEASGRTDSPPDPVEILADIATSARRKQVTDMLQRLVKETEPPRQLETIHEVATNPTLKDAKVLVTFGPLAPSGKEAIEEDLELILHENPALDEVHVTVQAVEYVVSGILASPLKKPITWYQASDLGVRVIPKDIEGFLIVLEERRAYVAEPDRPCVVFGTPVDERAEPGASTSDAKQSFRS